MPKLSKKISNLLDKHGPILVERKKRLSETYNNEYILNSEMEKEIEKVTKLIFNFKLSDLNRVRTNIADERITLSEEVLSDKRKGMEIDSETELAEKIIKMKLDIVTKAIEDKREYHKKFTHPVERNIIEHGVMFNTGLPAKGSANYKKIRTEDGIIEFEKNGFRKLFYRNRYGNLLSTYDTKMFISLLKLWNDKGKNQSFKVTYRELLTASQSDLNSGEYPLITESLQTLARTEIIMEEYFDPNRKTFTKTHIHHPIQDAVIDPKNLTATIELSNYIHDSLAAGHYITINMALFNDLANDTSKNLYIDVISKLPENVRVIEINTLIEHLGIRANTHYKATRLLLDAFDELIDFNVIESYTVIKEGRTNRSICFVPTDLQYRQHTEGIPLLSIV